LSIHLLRNKLWYGDIDSMYMRSQAFLLVSVVVMIFILIIAILYFDYQKTIQNVRFSSYTDYNIYLLVLERSVLNIQKICAYNNSLCQGVNNTFRDKLLGYFNYYYASTNCRPYLLYINYSKDYVLVHYVIYLDCGVVSYDLDFYGYYNKELNETVYL